MTILTFPSYTGTWTWVWQDVDTKNAWNASWRRCLPQSDWYIIASPVIWHLFERKHFGFKSVWAIEFDDKDSGYPSTTISEVSYFSLPQQFDPRFSTGKPPPFVVDCWLHGARGRFASVPCADTWVTGREWQSKDVTGKTWKNTWKSAPSIHQHIPTISCNYKDCLLGNGEICRKQLQQSSLLRIPKQPRGLEGAPGFGEWKPTGPKGAGPLTGW